MAALSPFVCVTGLGLLTPLGATPAQTVAAIKAGASAYAGSDFLNQLRLPMTTAQVPEGAMAPLSDELAAAKLPSRMVRLLRLALPAMQQAMAAFNGEQPLPLFLAGPEQLPNRANPVSGNLIHYLLQDEALPIARAKCRYFASGRSGLLEAIELAFQCFEQTTENYILVGAVDTFIDAATLGQLDDEGRVLAEHVGDGFAPAEGAGFMLLCRPGLLATIPHALYRPGLAVEPGSRYSSAPMLGQGLDLAVKQALNSAPRQTISDFYSTMNGESFFTKELGVTLIRNAGQMAATIKHHHPADSLGDMGAAAPAALIALAMDNLAEATSQTQLIFASSDMGSRAAVCIAKPSSQTHQQV